MNDYGLAIISRLDTDESWDVIINSTQPDFNQVYPLMDNSFNEYVEWKNCGVVYRAIRKEDLKEYNMGEGDD